MNTNSALVGELTRGFHYVPKGGEIIMEVSASHGVEAVGTVGRFLPFRPKHENEMDDISLFSFVATMNDLPIWEGTIRIPSEELDGVYAHICIRRLLERFDTDTSGEDDCD